MFTEEKTGREASGLQHPKMSEHSTTTMRSRRRREGRSSPTHRELHSIDNACNFERSPLYGLPQEAERTPQSSRNHGRWPDQPAGIACRATCNQPTSHHPGLQGKTRASQREASREASQREAPSTPSPGAAHTEALLGGPTAQPVSTTGRLKPAPCATEYKGSLPYHADVSSRKTVVSGQTQSPSDVRQPIRHNEKATQSFYDPEVEGCENHPGTCNPSADASHRKTTRAKRNGPRDTTFVNQRPPRPQRHTQTTDEPYLPRRYRHQADSRPRPPPSQSGAKTSFIKHESDLRPGVRRVKKRSPSEVNVSPDTSKPQRRPRTRQRSARPVYDPATSNAPHAGHFHNPQGQRKRSEPTIRVPASQLQLRVQEGHALGSDLRQPPEFLQPPDGPSRRACKRRRARERRREQLCTADIQERDRQIHVTHTQLLGYTRERMLQLDPTLTAAPDLNASQLNATAYARSLRPHCRDVPIQGVSAMGPTPPTGSSGWRKPENNHYSWFRNQHTDGMGTALSGSSYVLSQGNPYQPVLPVRGGRPLACHGSTGNPISHPTVLSGNPSVLSGSSGTGNVGRGNTPMHRDASPLANPTPIAIAESAIRRESSRTNDGGKEIIPANVTSYASTVLSQPLKQKQPCRELEHVGSLSWNIGPNSDTQPSKDTEYVNATTGANISDRRRKQTVQSAVKKPGTKPNTGGEGSNTVAPASNQENTKQPAQKPNPGTNGDTASVPATNHDNAKQTAQVEELKTGGDDDDGVTPVEPNATQQQPPQASGDEGASASSSSADDENDDGKSNPSNHDDNNNSNPFDDDDDDVQELKPTKEELEDALKPIYGDPAIAGFAMSVGENNLFQLGSKLERRCRSNLALAKRDLNKAIAQKSDIPRKVSDRLNKLAKTLTDLDTDVKLMSTALEKNAKDVKDLADELTYIRRYFMTKVQDIHFGLNWDIPTGNTPPASEHGEMPHQGSQPAINSQAQSAAPSRRYSFEVADGNQQHQQQQQLQQQIPIEEVRDGGITAPVTNATDNPNANSVLDIVDDGHGNNFNMNIDPTTGLLLFNGGNPTSATAQLPPTQQQSAGQDRTQQQQPQPPSIQVRRPQGYKPPEAVNAMTISDWRGGFDGKPDEDFSLFIEKFELHCNANSTDKDKWATLLRLRLSGLAQSIISGLTDEDKDNYGKLKATLTKTFGREDQYLTARDKIRKLQYAISFNDLLATLSSLMPKAYPMENQDFRNGTMYGVLMEKLPPDLIIELKRKGCETLNDLIRMAPKTEALIKDIRSMNPKYQVQPVQRVNATFITEEQTNVGMVGTDLAVRDAPRPSSRDQPPPQRYKANRRTTTQPQQQSRRPATQPYYGQSGRNIRPDYQGNRPQYQQATRGNPNLICGHCGKTGHCTLDCRARLREKEQERNRDQNRNNRGNQRNPPQRYNTFQQPWRQQRRQDLPIYCNKCNQPGHVAVGCRNNIHYTQPQIDIMSDTRSGVDYATHQMQQLQLAQPQYRPIQYQQQQPHHTAVAMTTQAMDMPHRSASAPMTYQQPQQPMQPAQQQQVAIPLQQSTTQQPQNPNPLNAIQQATGIQQPLGTPEDTVTRSYTDEDFRKMEEKLDLMVSKVYQKQDQEKPSTDILATLTRHENGTQPQYVPVDHRLAIIPAIVQGYTCNALFDTGSSITVAPIAMAEILKIQLDDSDKSITAVTGHTAEVTKKGRVRLTIAGQTRDVEMFFTGNFLGTKNPYDFIIGVDVMRSFPDATISVSNRKLTIGTKTICWKTKAESMQEGRKVFLLQEANIPPHTTTRVGALIDKSRGDVTQSVTIEQAGKHPATVTPTVSMVDSDNRCEVMLHNPTNAPLIIRPYTVVAEALNIIVGDDGILTNYPEITAGAALSFSKRHATDPTYVVDYSHCDCNDAQKAQLKELLDRYADQFSKNGYDLSIAKVNPMQIRTTTEEPPRPTIYSTNRALRPHVHEALENMREMGCIRESNTPWLSPLVMVKKKTGDLRPCIDLRKLNRITIPDYFPLPKVTDAIDRIAGCNFFTGLDLSKGFWQIPLSDDASWKCGIISENKVYQCIAMPFGLCNAPSAFMRAMDTILGPLKETTVVYIDDVVIMTKPDSFDQHLVDIEEVVKRFKQYNIKINPVVLSLRTRKPELDNRGQLQGGPVIGNQNVKSVSTEMQPSASEKIAINADDSSQTTHFVPHKFLIIVKIATNRNDSCRCEGIRTFERRSEGNFITFEINPPGVTGNPTHSHAMHRIQAIIETIKTTVNMISHNPQQKNVQPENEKACLRAGTNSTATTDRKAADEPGFMPVCNQRNPFEQGSFFAKRARMREATLVVTAPNNPYAYPPPPLGKVDQATTHKKTQPFRGKKTHGGQDRWEMQPYFNPDRPHYGGKGAMEPPRYYEVSEAECAKYFGKSNQSDMATIDEQVKWIEGKRATNPSQPNSPTRNQPPKAPSSSCASKDCGCHDDASSTQKDKEDPTLDLKFERIANWAAPNKPLDTEPCNTPSVFGDPEVETATQQIEEGQETPLEPQLTATASANEQPSNDDPQVVEDKQPDTTTEPQHETQLATHPTTEPQVQTSNPVYNASQEVRDLTEALHMMDISSGGMQTVYEYQGDYHTASGLLATHPYYAMYKFAHDSWTQQTALLIEQFESLHHIASWSRQGYTGILNINTWTPELREFMNCYEQYTRDVAHKAHAFECNRVNIDVGTGHNVHAVATEDNLNVLKEAILAYLEITAIPNATTPTMTHQQTGHCTRALQFLHVHVSTLPELMTMALDASRKSDLATLTEIAREGAVVAQLYFTQFPDQQSIMAMRESFRIFAAMNRYRIDQLTQRAAMHPRNFATVQSAPQKEQSQSKRTTHQQPQQTPGPKRPTKPTLPGDTDKNQDNDENMQSSDSGSSSSSSSYYTDSDSELLATPVADRFVFWNGDYAFPATYGLVEYFYRRAKEFGEPNPNRDWIPVDLQPAVKKAFNNIFGKGFRPLRAFTNGSTTDTLNMRTRDRIERDIALINRPSGQKTHDGKDETFRDVELEARMTENPTLRDRISATSNLTRKLVSEAFDRVRHYENRDVKEWDATSVTSRAETSFSNKPELEILNDIHPTTFYYYYDRYRLSYAQVQNLINRKKLNASAINEEIRNSVRLAYEHYYSGMNDGQVQNLLFPDMTRHRVIGPPIIDPDPMRAGAQRLLSTATHTQVQYNNRTWTETYGMCIWLQRNTKDHLDHIPGQDVVCANQSYNMLTEGISAIETKFYFFMNVPLPTREESIRLDVRLLQTQTWDEYALPDGSVVDETYAMVAYDLLTIGSTLRPISEETQQECLAALHRLFDGMDTPFVEKKIYYDQDWTDVELIVLNDEQATTYQQETNVQMEVDNPPPERHATFDEDGSDPEVESAHPPKKPEDMDTSELATDVPMQPPATALTAPASTATQPTAPTAPEQQPTTGAKRTVTYVQPSDLGFTMAPRNPQQQNRPATTQVTPVRQPPAHIEPDTAPQPVLIPSAQQSVNCAKCTRSHLPQGICLTITDKGMVIPIPAATSYQRFGLVPCTRCEIPHPAGCHIKPDPAVAAAAAQPGTQQQQRQQQPQRQQPQRQQQPAPGTGPLVPRKPSTSEETPFGRVPPKQQAPMSFASAASQQPQPFGRSSKYAPLTGQKQTPAPAKQRPVAQSTTSFAKSAMSFRSSTSHMYRPSGEEIPFQASGTKRIQPRQPKALAANRTAKESIYAGDRDVIPDLLRDHTDPIPIEFATPVYYTLIFTTSGFAIGWAEPERNYLAIERKVNFPPIMQFGDRYFRAEYTHHIGDVQEVFTYHPLVHGNQTRQEYGTLLKDCVHRETGRLMATASARKFKRIEGSKGRVRDRIALIRTIDFDVGTNSQCRRWKATICALDSTELVQAENEYISYELKNAPAKREPVFLSGTTISANYPRFSAYGCYFPESITKVDASATQAPKGFIISRVSLCTCKDTIANFNPNAIFNVNTSVEFKTQLAVNTDMMGATSSWEMQNIREQALLTRVPLTNSEWIAQYQYGFDIVLTGMSRQQLQALAGVNKNVRVFTIDDQSKAETDVFHAILDRKQTTYHNTGLPNRVVLRHIVRQDDFIESAVEHADDQRNAQQRLAQTDQVSDVAEQFAKLRTTDQISNRFFEDKLKGRNLYLEQIPVLAADLSSHKQIRFLTRIPIGAGTAYAKINSILNGYEIRLIQDWNEELRLDRRPEVKALYNFNNRYRAELRKETIWNEDQKAMAISIVADMQPVVTVNAYCGTGKSTMIASICSSLLNREKRLAPRLPYNIRIATPSNSAAISVANKFGILVSKNQFGRGQALLIQSPYYISGIVTRDASSFTMTATAKRVLSMANISIVERRLLENYVNFVRDAKCQADCNIGLVIATLIKNSQPKVVIATLDSISLHPVLRHGATHLITDESTRLREGRLRTTVATMHNLQQVVIVGDRNQIGPFIDLADSAGFSKFGARSLMDAMNGRNLGMFCKITLNFRSIRGLVEPLSQSVEDYSDMKSAIDDPDWNGEHFIRLPPVPMKECPVTLLHVPGRHKKEISGSVSNQAQEQIVISLLHLYNEYRLACGFGVALDILVVCGYAATVAAIKNATTDIPFTATSGIMTCEEAQGKEAERTILVIGRTRSSKTDLRLGDFARDDKRIATTLGRPMIGLVIVSDMNYATEKINNVLARFVLAANIQTPVLDGSAYVEMLQTHVAAGKAQLAAGQPPFGFKRYGNGVLKYHLVSGEPEEDFHHIATNRSNILNDWLNPANYLPEVPEGYVPLPTPHLDDPLEEEEPAQQDPAP